MPLKCTGKQTKFAKTASGFLIGRCPKSNPAKPWIQLFLRLEKPAAAGPRRHSRTLPHHLTTSIKVKMASIVAQQLAAGYVIRAIISRRLSRASVDVFVIGFWVTRAGRGTRQGLALR